MNYAFLIGLPVAFWVVFRLGLPNVRFEFDHGPNMAMGTFFPMLAAWHRSFFALAIASFAGFVYLFAHQIEPAALILLASGIYALLFNLLINLFYESYLGVKYPRDWNMNDAPRSSNYTAARYSIVLATGLAAVLFFVVGAALGCWMLG